MKEFLPGMIVKLNNESQSNVIDEIEKETGSTIVLLYSRPTKSLNQIDNLFNVLLSNGETRLLRTLPTDVIIC